MASSDSDSNSTSAQPSWLQRTALLAVFVLLGTSALVRSAGVVSPGTAVGVVFVLAGIGLVLLWRRAATADPSRSAHAEADEPAASETTDEESTAAESSVWNAIPSWQYEGRHVESGGLARGEQEQALQDIQRQAEELSDDPAEK